MPAAVPRLFAMHSAVLHLGDFVAGVWRHLFSLQAAVFLAALGGAMTWIRRSIWLEDGQRKQLLRCVKHVRDWIKTRSFGVSAFLLLAFILFASWRAYDDLATELDQYKTIAVSFNYENNAHYLVHVSSTEPKNDRTVVFVQLNTNMRLRDAMVYLTSIHPRNDIANAPITSVAPLRSNQRMAIGIWNGQDQWKPRSLTKSDWFIPFNLLDKSSRLAIFTNTYTTELDNIISNIPRGEYEVTFEVDAPELSRGASQKFFLHWSGESDGFSMTKAD